MKNENSGYLEQSALSRINYSVASESSRLNTGAPFQMSHNGVEVNLQKLVDAIGAQQIHVTSVQRSKLPFIAIQSGACIEIFDVRALVVVTR
jgi:hypothetical protein